MPVKSRSPNLKNDGINLASVLNGAIPEDESTPGTRETSSMTTMVPPATQVPSSPSSGLPKGSESSGASIGQGTNRAGSGLQAPAIEQQMLGILQGLMQSAISNMSERPSVPNSGNGENTLTGATQSPSSAGQIPGSTSTLQSLASMPSTGVGPAAGISPTSATPPAQVTASSAQTNPDNSAIVGNLLQSLLSKNSADSFIDSIRFAAMGVSAVPSSTPTSAGPAVPPTNQATVTSPKSADVHIDKRNAWHPCQNMSPPKSMQLREGNSLNRYYFQPEEQQTTRPGHSSGRSSSGFSVDAIRKDFPILHQKVNGRPLIWFDNAATSQKPIQVIDAISKFYRCDNSNIHRAAHALAARATDAYENARSIVQRHINARSPNEIIFVRGTTEAINLVAQSWGRKNIGAGDIIIVSEMEHHANIVPWQMLAQETGAVLKVIPVDETGDLDLVTYQKLLSPAVKLVSLSQASNVLGTVNPVPLIASMAKAVGAHVLVDGAQSIPHFNVDVQSMGCDWFVFSGHKIFGPTGVGVLYGREDVLTAMPPWQGGGNMIKDVTFEKTVYADLPAKFEAGTGILAGAVGLGAALEYVESIGSEQAHAHEQALLADATDRLMRVPGLRIIGQSKNKVAVVSFVMDKLSSGEIGKALDQDGIAVRSGHHCAQPILRRYGLESSVRSSFAFYNTHQEVEAFCASIARMRK